MSFTRHILSNKLAMVRFFAIGIPLVLVWIAFNHTDEFGLTPGEYTQDAFVSDDWVGWIHPFGNEGRVLKVGPFDTVQNCQAYAFDHLKREYESWEDAEYYCGYRCGMEEELQREDQCKLIRK
jgi:hypothetical protein